MNTEQIRFDPLEFEDRLGMSPIDARKEAQTVRRMVAKVKKQEGHEVRSWTLTGQLRKYKEFGVPDGRVRPVYYLNVTSKDAFQDAWDETNARWKAENPK